MISDHSRKRGRPEGATKRAGDATKRAADTAKRGGDTVKRMVDATQRGRDTTKGEAKQGVSDAGQGARAAAKGAGETMKRDQAAAPKTNPAGHVEFDSRGNSVWHWDIEQSDSTSRLLESLDIDDLELEPTRSVRMRDKAERPAEKSGKEPRTSRGASRDPDESPRSEAGGGFDPYNRS
jgi:hypothetical protein